LDVCRLAWAGDPRVRTRTQASLAVSADGTRWTLLNASPDLRAQIQATQVLQPKGLRGSPIEAVVLTGGEIDQTAGLLSLRERSPFMLMATAATLAAVADNPMFGALASDVVSRRAITPGDTYLYLPKEKVLVTGDILLSPYPFAIGGTYPAEWLKTLGKLAALEPAVIIPGHGDAETSSDFLRSNIALFQDVIQQVKDANTKGMTLDQTAEALAKQSSDLAAKVGIKDAETADAFKAYFLDVFVKRAYRELDKPLGDLPDGLK
jgi:glyoxylase-like metal-dependent hydrolase (beta-lactamase superfamily II)